METRAEQDPVPHTPGQAAVDQRFLGVYISDRLALSEGALALAERVAAAGRWHDQRPQFARLVETLRDNTADLEQVLADREIRPDRFKRAAARIGERLGRFKGNGRLVRSSPLNRLVELEGLLMLVGACVQTWDTVLSLGIDVERARAARERLLPHEVTLRELHPGVARRAFAD